MLKSVHRELKQDMSKLQFKQFEIKGYETMITRVMEGQLTSHPDMNEQFLTVTQALEKQKVENDQFERLVMEKLQRLKEEQARKRAIEQAHEQAQSESEYYDEEEEEAEEETKEAPKVEEPKRKGLGFFEAMAKLNASGIVQNMQ